MFQYKVTEKDNQIIIPLFIQYQVRFYCCHRLMKYHERLINLINS